MDIEMFGQVLPEQANAPDSATTYGFAGPVTGTLPPLVSHQLIPNLGHAIKGPYSEKVQTGILAIGRTRTRSWPPCLSSSVAWPGNEDRAEMRDGDSSVDV